VTLCRRSPSNSIDALLPQVTTIAGSVATNCFWLASSHGSLSDPIKPRTAIARLHPESYCSSVLANHSNTIRDNSAHSYCLVAPATTRKARPEHGRQDLGRRGQIAPRSHEPRPGSAAVNPQFLPRARRALRHIANNIVSCPELHHRADVANRQHDHSAAEPHPPTQATGTRSSAVCIANAQTYA